MRITCRALAASRATSLPTAARFEESIALAGMRSKCPSRGARRDAGVRGQHTWTGRLARLYDASGVVT